MPFGGEGDASSAGLPGRYPPLGGAVLLARTRPAVRASWQVPARRYRGGGSGRGNAKVQEGKGAVVMELGSDDRDLERRLRRPRAKLSRMSGHLFRTLVLHRLRKSKSLSGSCTKQEIFSNPRGSEFSERLSLYKIHSDGIGVRKNHL